MTNESRRGGTLFEVHYAVGEARGPSLPQGPPAFAHYSPGVDVEVFALQPV